MQLITTKTAKKKIGQIVNRVSKLGIVYGIGTPKHIDAILIKFPENFNKDVSIMTNINANSRSFDFLRDEPEMYSVSDLKRQYA